MALRKDSKHESIQGFAPKKIIQVLASEEWTPDPTDEAFCVPDACTYRIDMGLEGTLPEGSIRVIAKGVKYSFQYDMKIEVM